MKFYCSMLQITAISTASINNLNSDLLQHARSTTLKFNQRMLYTHAHPLPLQLSSRVNSLIENLGTIQDDRMLRSLLYLSLGELDAAHSIVQRMNTPDALYVHALIHRLEGHHIGEAQMKGWSNADYWNDQIGYHPNYHCLCDLIDSESCNDYRTSNQRVSSFVKAIKSTIRVDGKGVVPVEWLPSLFLRLCIDGFRFEDEVCVTFCEYVTTFEYRLLLEKHSSMYQ